ncbi:hypothetical protein P692DRAFT_20239134 [Suillus brevipes Sb2]|nr:hypothetical protein P692DRAFT_20239134 [Suillus brevipes Sb2]
MISFISSWTAVRQIYKAIVQIDLLPFLLQLASLVLTAYNIVIGNTNLVRSHKYRACDLDYTISWVRARIFSDRHWAFTTIGSTFFLF